MDMSNGKMSTGWKQIDGSWYYFNSNGHMMTGWIQLDGKYYYLNPANEGRMIAGTTATINGTQYTFDASGICQNAGGVSAQTPGTVDNNNSTGTSGGPGASGGSSGISSNGPGGTSGRNPGTSSGNNSPGGSSSGGLQAGRTDGPG